MWSSSQDLRSSVEDDCTIIAIERTIIGEIPATVKLLDGAFSVVLMTTVGGDRIGTSRQYTSCHVKVPVQYHSSERQCQCTRQVAGNIV